MDELTILMLGALALYILSKTGSGNASLVSQEGSFPSTPPGSLTGALDSNFNQVFPMNLSAEGVAFIQVQETGTGEPQLTAYPDAGGYSIGFGHFITGNEASVIGVNLGAGSTITTDQANALFMHDVAGAEAAVNQAVSVPLSQGQYDALVDFAFNVGSHAFETSTLLRDLNSGDYAGAAEQFSVWNISAGKVNSALVARRAAEAALFA